MKKDKKFVVIKDIPLQNGKKIPKGTEIFRSHECYYMIGGLLPKSFQEDFDKLVEYEEKHGWNYLTVEREVVGKSII